MVKPLREWFLGTRRWNFNWCIDKMVVTTWDA